MSCLSLVTRHVWRKQVSLLHPYVCRHPVRHASLPVRKNSNLEGRVALVTGGTNGIGLAIAKRLAENGANVVVSSQKQANVEKAVEGLRAEGLMVSGHACNIGKTEERNNLISHVMSLHGDVNILVQNAGVNPHPVGILDTSESAIDKTYEIHIKSNFRIIQELFPHMKKSENPCSIILTSSLSAYTSHLFPGIYAITKAGVNAMTRAFAADLNQYNIRINCITMGPIETDFMAPLAKNENILSTVINNVIIKRLGRPDEASGIAAYLASDDSSYVTGESFTIAGGAYCRI